MPIFSSPQVQTDPIYSLPHLYISGLNISYSLGSRICISPGQARDMNDNIDMPVSWPDLTGTINPPILFQDFQQPIVIDPSRPGLNGLDRGTLAASTYYAIYLLADSRGYNQTGAILSLTSNAAPLLPKGYDSYRLLGFTQTDVTSRFIYTNFKPQNMAYALTYYNNPPFAVLGSGTATTFTAIDLTTLTAIPTTTLPNIIAWLQVQFTPAAIGDTVQFRPTGSTATTNLVTITGVAAGIAQTQYVSVICGVGASKPEIDYAVSSSSCSVNVLVAAWTGVSNTAYPVLV